jgi:transglutaminase-like putative cysteine protease
MCRLIGTCLVLLGQHQIGVDLGHGHAKKDQAGVSGTLVLPQVQGWTMPTTRHVSAHLELEAHSPATLALQMSVARSPGLAISETWDVQLDGEPVDRQTYEGPHDSRTDVVQVTPGFVTVDYSADVSGRAEPAPPDRLDRWTYTRPSRYCPADQMAGFAAREFAGLGSADLLPAVSSWVGQRLSYLPGSSGPTDGAIDTLLAGAGVCRDYVHLVIALLRALDVPARLVAVYAPGLEPMDFHAVAEALVDDAWWVVDATLLAPRPGLVRITTGRDAADTSFLTVAGGNVVLTKTAVTAVIDGGLPDDDPRQLVALT